ncbi:hypothetical protein [Roseomonas indoligenes]|uniref:Uncharacterized protein n=1 Tax=Roseomonas indoligenes TaxID=2820811 RepID=A0A940MWE0_9PROT|nr:hypothetical protein [Pararoseomonas indoligenes]MBP0494644.1 hypothetical protein [Pararoseomonas indoligenes]
MEQDSSMNEAALRRSMAAAIRTVLEEGLRKTDDPVHYLRSAAEEVRQLVDLFEQGGPESRTDGALIRAILADEVEAAAQEMIRRLHH